MSTAAMATGDPPPFMPWNDAIGYMPSVTLSCGCTHSIFGGHWYEAINTQFGSVIVDVGTALWFWEDGYFVRDRDIVLGREPDARS